MARPRQAVVGHPPLAVGPNHRVARHDCVRLRAPPGEIPDRLRTVWDAYEL